PAGAAPLPAGLAGSLASVRPELPEGRVIAAAVEEEIAIETPLVSIRLSNRGGRATSWKLLNYVDEDGAPLDLVSPAGARLGLLPLQLLLEDAAATRALAEGLFRVERSEETHDGRPVTRVGFSWSDGKGTAATKTLAVPHDSYLAEFGYAAQVAGRPVAPTVVWGAGFSGHTGLESGQYADTTWAVAGKVDKPERRPRADIKPEEPFRVAATLAYAGVEDKYFAALFVPPLPVAAEARWQTLRLVEEGREHFHLAGMVRLEGVSQVKLFVGPKDHDLLNSLGYGLGRLVDFGFFSVIALPLFNAMKWLERYTGNFGWAIVILTIGIRLLFFPFMHRGQVKMKVMQEKMKKVQPKVKSMRERYRKLERKELERGNPRARYQLRQKMNDEMMALYREEGINPFGTMSGCLPLLVQIPILYGFYQILTQAIELRKAPFLLWITDLSQKDPYYVTPIVMGATMLIQQVMTSSSIPDPTQRRIMYLMPIMFTWFFLQFPSGLVLYWLVNNILGIAQQHLVNRHPLARAQTAST
ncbi:MAG: membrane protein insertase YidC, partial [Candidatus Polarisedimenticolia bacterium]